MIQTLISIQLWAQAEGKPAQTPEPFWMNLFLPMGILVLFIGVVVKGDI